MNEILKVENLATHFFTDKGVVKAVDGNTFTIHEGQTLGVVLLQFMKEKPWVLWGSPDVERALLQ